MKRDLMSGKRKGSSFPSCLLYGMQEGLCSPDKHRRRRMRKSAVCSRRDERERRLYLSWSASEWRDPGRLRLYAGVRSRFLGEIPRMLEWEVKRSEVLV